MNEWMNECLSTQKAHIYVSILCFIISRSILVYCDTAAIHTFTTTFLKHNKPFMISRQHDHGRRSILTFDCHKVSSVSEKKAF